MEKTEEVIKLTLKKWSEITSKIPNDLVDHLYIHDVEELNNYIFTHDVTSIYTIDRESSNPGSEFEFIEGEKNPKKFDLLKADKGNWTKKDKIIPFNRYRTTELIIPSTINTFSCEEKQICPKCDGEKRYE